ncbi:MAG TPA: SPFH domain-containing protein [Acidimicrobiales bacterium]|nr:SPFH domain-containing protein [Acidimicrobiales bacterium]
MDSEFGPWIIAGIVVAAIVFLVVLFKLMWRVAEPNEALIISGLRQGKRADSESDLGFKIITGKGTMVIPGVQTVRRLSLDLRQAGLAIECVTHQGIPLGVRGVVIYKVGDDFSSIANSARRFLDQQAEMDHRVHNVFAGHLRAIVGSMTVEEMIRDREKLTQLTRASSGVEMEKLGLIVDSLQIQEIEDPTGYIKNLAMPHAATVQREARIAQAGADRDATTAEQAAEAEKAFARRDSLIKQAGYQAEIDQASALAQQSGPLADATARQKVVVEETTVAELEGQREEQRLQATVRKPADAKAYQEVTLAKAQRDARVAAAEARRQEVELDAAANAHKVKLSAEAHAEEVRVAAAADAQHVKVKAEAEAEATRNVGVAQADATKAKGLAHADATRAQGMAEADSIKARADAMAENQDAVIGQELAQQWPAIVEAAAKPFGAVDQLIVLNGAQGLSEVLAQALSQGATGLKMARNLLGSGNLGADSEDEVVPNGSTPPPPAPPTPASTKES